MGSEMSDPLRYPAELNATTVTISQPFWLGKTEITRAQWEAIMGPITEATFINSPKDLKELSGNLPMADVTWEQAIQFCEKLTERERAANRLPKGYVYSLPTEAEWEYACRAGTMGLMPASEEERDASGWHMKNAGPWSYSMSARLHPVAQRKPNAWGFYDMLGNVREWVLDPVAPYPGGKVTDPLATKTVFPGKPQKEVIRLRVMRGGSWLDGKRSLRAAARDWANPTQYATPPVKQENGKPGQDFRTGITGFRLALIPEKQFQTAKDADKE